VDTNNISQEMFNLVLWPPFYTCNTYAYVIFSFQDNILNYFMKQKSLFWAILLDCNWGNNLKYLNISYHETGKALNI